jgi:hypothetical protein
MTKSFSLLVICEGPIDTRLHDARAELKVAELVAQITPDQGICAFLPDADEPLAAELTLIELELDTGSEITLARPAVIEVIVRYAGENRHTERPPNQRVKHVLRWALGKHGYGIPAAQHANFELADSTTGQAVDPASTIAHYVHDHRRRAVFDLREIDGHQG